MHAAVFEHFDVCEINERKSIHLPILKKIKSIHKISEEEVEKRIQ